MPPQFTGKQHLIAFDKSGHKVGVVPIPDLVYLGTHKDWVHNALDKSPSLDGMAIIVDWEKREIISVRYAD